MDEDNVQGISKCESNAPEELETSKKFGLFPLELLQNRLGEGMDELESTVEFDLGLVWDKCFKKGPNNPWCTSICRSKSCNLPCIQRINLLRSVYERINITTNWVEFIILLNLSFTTSSTNKSIF